MFITSTHESVYYDLCFIVFRSTVSGEENNNNNRNSLCLLVFPSTITTPHLSLSLSVMALGACNPPHWKNPQKEQNVQRKEHNWTRPKRSYIKDSSFPHPRSVFEPVYHLNKPLPTSLHLQRHCLAECRDRVHTSPHSTQPLGRSQVTVHERKAAVTA